MFSWDLIAGIIATVIIGALSLDILITRRKNRKMFKQLVQAELNLMAVSDKLSKVLATQDGTSVEKSEGFLRFVSESREWAFKYIEEVQAAIIEFDHHIGPMVKHYRSTNKSLYRKQKEIMDRVASAYEALMDVMPDEEDYS